MSGGPSGRSDDWRKESIPTGGGSSSGPNAGDVCDFDEKVTLNSPHKSVVNSLHPGDELKVTFAQGPPIQLLAETKRGEVAGAITADLMMRLIACIKKGVLYRATVVSVNGGVCVVRISRL